MEYKGYIGKVELDDEAGILHGEVVGIRDVVTFEGRSVTEVRRAFVESVDDYLKFCRQQGEEPDRPCSGHFVVRIDSDLHHRANMVAGAAGKSLNALVAECLEKEVSARFPAVSKSRRPQRPRTRARPARRRSGRSKVIMGTQLRS